MSQQNSDPLFDSVEFGTPMEMPSQMAPPTQTHAVVGNVGLFHGFTIYTVILIVSFLMLTTAGILLFLDAGKY